MKKKKDELGNKIKLMVILDQVGREMRGEEIHDLILVLDHKRGIKFPGYRFVPYFGQYSSDLQDDINFLVSLGNLDIVHEQFNPIRYKISNQGSSIVYKRREEDPLLRKFYNETSEAVNHLIHDPNLPKMSFDALNEDLMKPAYPMKN